MRRHSGPTVFPCARSTPLKEAINRIQDRAIMYFSLDRKSAIEKLSLLDDPIRLREHLRRNRQADLLGRLEIDDQLELRRLLDRNIARLGTFQNLVHIRGSAPAQVGNVHAVKHEPPGFSEIVLVVHDGEPVLHRKLYDLCSLRTEDAAV